MNRRTVLSLLVSSGIPALTGCRQSDRGSTATPEGSGNATTDSPPSMSPSPTPSSLSTDVEQRFDTVVDMVEDAGCDPSGQEVCDAAVDRAARDGALLTFPSGTYRFDQAHRWGEFTRLGFRGTGDVTFVPPDGFNDKLLAFIGDWILFDGIDVDVSAPETTAGLRFISRRGFHIEDVEYLGRGQHSDEAVVNAFSLAVTDPGSSGTVRNVVAKQGSAIGHYKNGNGRVGIWIGQNHRGRINVLGCNLEEFGNNGIYASRCFGATRVIGGYYRNNNVCSVRLGGRGSVVRDVTIELDVDTYDGPSTRTEDMYNTRAIVIEQGAYTKPGRVRIEGCDINVRSVDRSQGGIVVWPTGNGPRISDTRIAVEADWISAIRGLAPADRVKTAEMAPIVRGTRIVGGAGKGAAIRINDRPGTHLEQVEVEQPPAARDGVQLIASNPCRITSSRITAGRFPILAMSPVLGTRTCLVVLEGDTRLAARQPPTDALRTTRLEGAVTSGGYGADRFGRRCIGPEILAESADGSGVGIATVLEDSVRWAPRSSIGRVDAP